MNELNWRKINSSAKEIHGDDKKDEQRHKNFCNIVQGNGFYKCAKVPQNSSTDVNKLSIDIKTMIHGDVFFEPDKEEQGGCGRVIALDNLMAFKNEKTNEIIFVSHPYLYDIHDLFTWCSKAMVGCYVCENVGFYRNCKTTVIVGKQEVIDKSVKNLDKKDIKHKFYCSPLE